MSDSPNPTCKFPTPGRFVWLLVNASLIGIATPLGIGALTTLASYYPSGADLPRFLATGTTGCLFLILAAVPTMLMVATVLLILVGARHLLLLFCMLLVSATFGVIPGVLAHRELRAGAFLALAARSVPLIAAIRAHEREMGAPPKALADLVPRYLPEVPGTGMVLYPDYQYAEGSGWCEDNDTWHLSVDAGDVLNWNVFFYCPSQQYPRDIDWQWVEIIGDWGYLHE